jgi:phosphatidylglycerophosphatase A
MNAPGSDWAVLGKMLGGWEIILILAVVLILLGARHLPGLARDVVDPADPLGRLDRLTESLILFLAQGFGSGRAPFAPGTFGSLVGMLWFLLLVDSGHFGVFVVGTILGILVSVPVCAAGERILRQKDPGSIVLDEIVAVPLCFAAWVTVVWARTDQMPTLESFFRGYTWIATLVVLALFRLFDILKPWPVRQSQRLPGGWGVVVDDVLAALYVALISVLFFR